MRSILLNKTRSFVLLWFYSCFRFSFLLRHWEPFIFIMNPFDESHDNNNLLTIARKFFEQNFVEKLISLFAL